MNLQDIKTEVIEISKEAGSFLIREQGKLKKSDIETKSKHDYVTYVDKSSEKLIIEKLSEILPESGFIAEENTSSKKGEKYNWIIDPLDGTTNYIHGLNPFCVSIALMEDEELVLGVIYDPRLDECFHAYKNGKAFLNDTEIKVTNTKTLDRALIATGFPYSDYSLLENYMKLFKWTMMNTQGVRRLGSAAIDMAYVACGRMDGFYEYGLKAWDVAAGAVIIKEAGGKVSDFKGENDFLFSQELIAFNSNLMQDFIDVTQKFFQNKK